MNRRFASGLFLLCLATTGCGHRRPEVAAAAPPVIPVAKPVERKVTDYVDFTGRTEAVKSVAVKARVTGYLTKMPFKEGSEVKKGDLLFEIDPRPYQAQLDQAVSQIKLYEASLQLARANYARDLELQTRVAGAVTQAQLDQDRATVDEADSRVKTYEASAEVARLNHKFTTVTAEIDGQISRYYLTEGNLVNQDQTLLATIVSLDPMYVYFDMDESTLLSFRRAVSEGRIQTPEPGKYPVYIGLQGEEGYPHKGFINYVSPLVNPGTASISVRAVVDNPEPKKGHRLLSPGMFVRVRFPIGQEHKALLVIDRAIGSDQGLKYVYVLDADNKAQSRRVTTGALQQEDGLRVISKGIEAGDWIIVGGIQQVRPRMVIQPERLPAMPTLAQPSGGLAPQGEASGKETPSKKTKG